MHLGGESPLRAVMTGTASLSKGLLGLYFPPEANEAEVAMMPNAELRPIESVWGHLAGGPGFNPPDAAFVDAALGELPGT